MRAACGAKDCDKPVVSFGLCDTHRKRLQRRGTTEQTRPWDWGMKEKHPLHESWKCFKKHVNGICSEWRFDFWLFAKEIGEKPSAKHRLTRKDSKLPIDRTNFEWREVSDGSESKTAYLKRWRKDNPHKVRHTYLKKHFKITLAEYEQMLEQQNNGCAICGHKCKTYGNLSVDHCHKTGKIRGLLCTNCNRAIGLFSDNVDFLKNAIRYLQSSTSNTGTSEKEIINGKS